MKKNRIIAFTIGFTIGLTTGLFVMPLINNNGGTSAMRTIADINAEPYHYLDNEAIALADSISDTGLRVVAYEAYNEINDIRAEAGLNELQWDKNLETVASVRAKECSQKFSHTSPLHLLL